MSLEGATETETGRRRRFLYYLRALVYTLGALLGLALLTIGTVAVIAELKGTWHWQIHLETTIAYTAVFITWVLAVLGPSAGLLWYGKRRWEP